MVILDPPPVSTEITAKVAAAEADCMTIPVLHGPRTTAIFGYSGRSTVQGAHNCVALVNLPGVTDEMLEVWFQNRRPAELGLEAVADVALWFPVIGLIANDRAAGTISF